MSTEQSASDREELIRLRAEIASLRAAQGSDTTAVPRPGAGWKARLRTVGATILIILGCLLAPHREFTRLSLLIQWPETISPRRAKTRLCSPQRVIGVTRGRTPGTLST
jgi:hypothetical protein